MIKGIEFVLTNGSRDWYDPVDLDTGFSKTELEYIIQVNANTYTLLKKDVVSFKYYDLEGVSND